MTAVDPWAPVERDWKEFLEPALAFDNSKFDRAFLDTTCEACGKHVNALIIDGPDPVFVEVQCPRDVCGAVWSERVT